MTRKGIAVHSIDCTYLITKALGGQVSVIQFENIGASEAGFSISHSNYWLVNPMTLDGAGGLSNEVIEALKGFICVNYM